MTLIRTYDVYILPEKTFLYMTNSMDIRTILMARPRTKKNPPLLAVSSVPPSYANSVNDSSRPCPMQNSFDNENFERKLPEMTYICLISFDSVNLGRSVPIVNVAEEATASTTSIPRRIQSTLNLPPSLPTILVCWRNKSLYKASPKLRNNLNGGREMATNAVQTLGP